MGLGCPQNIIFWIDCQIGTSGSHTGKGREEHQNQQYKNLEIPQVSRPSLTAPYPQYEGAVNSSLSLIRIKRLRKERETKFWIIGMGFKDKEQEGRASVRIEGDMDGIRGRNEVIFGGKE